MDTFATAQADVDAAIDALEDAEEQLECLEEAATPPGDPCTEYGDVYDAVSDLTNRLRELGLCTSEFCDDLDQSAESARDEICGAFSQEALDEISDAEEAVTETLDKAEEFKVLIDTWGDIMTEQRTAMGKVRDFFDDYVHEYNESGIMPYAEWIGIALFAGTILATLLAVAETLAADFRAWIEAYVAFPNSMVDR